MSPTFVPPTVDDLDAVPLVQPLEMDRYQWAQAKHLFRHYGGNPRGLSVVKVAGHYTTVDSPYAATLVGNDGVDFFLGGHVYTVTQAVATALAADGYATTPSPPGLSWGSYASAFWGEEAGYTWGVL